MSKMLDNSGKNTENEIYDTSHRQYGDNPGTTAAWKDNLIGFLGIVLSIILVMLIDCFILHPIPAPEGTFAIQGQMPSFNLADSGCEYADAKILSSNATHRGEEIYLVEHNGEIHLIGFRESMLFTRKIADDILITGELPQTVKLRIGLTTWTMTINEQLRLRDISSFGVGQSWQTTMTVYAVVGVAIALTGSLIWHKIKNLFK